MKRLPKSLYKYFWDTDPAGIDTTVKSQYVIERILEWGRKPDLQWLKREYGQARVEEVFKFSRQLTYKNAQFFAHIWDISRQEVLCLQPEFRRIHRSVWTR